MKSKLIHFHSWKCTGKWRPLYLGLNALIKHCVSTDLTNMDNVLLCYVCWCYIIAFMVDTCEIIFFRVVSLTQGILTVSPDAIEVIQENIGTTNKVQPIRHRNPSAWFMGWTINDLHRLGEDHAIHTRHVKCSNVTIHCSLPTCRIFQWFRRIWGITEIYYIMFCHVMSFILCYIILYYIILCHIILYYIILYHIISYYIILYYIISYHTISHHIISYYIYISEIKKRSHLMDR